MRAKDKMEVAHKNDLFHVVLGGIGLLAFITLITVLSLQPLPSVILNVILIYVFIFLCAGLLVAAIVNRWVDNLRSGSEDMR